MNKKVIERISPAKARDIAENIWRQIISCDADFKRIYEKDEFAQVVFLYYLWKMRKNKNINTWEKIRLESRRDNAIFYMIGINWFPNDLSEKEASKILEKMISLVSDYSEEELAASVLNNPLMNRVVIDEPTESVEKLVNMFLDLKGSDNLIEVNSGMGEYLMHVQEEKPKLKCTAISGENSKYTLSYIKSEVRGFESMNYIGIDNFEQVESAKVFVNCSVGENTDRNERLFPADTKEYLLDYWEDFPIDNYNEWMLCAAGIAMTNFKGKVTAIMDAGELTLLQSKGNREKLCLEGYIEGVVALPERLYRRTNLNLYLVIFGYKNKGIKFLDARKQFIADRDRSRRLNTISDEMIEQIKKNYDDKEAVTYVDIETIKNNDYNLNPILYTTDKEYEGETINLGKYILDVRRGMTIVAREKDGLISEELSQFECVDASMIADGMIRGPRNYYHGEIKKSNKNIAHKNDILLSKTGNPFKVAVVEQECVVIGASLYVLKLDNTINPYLVKSFLSSERGQDEMMKIASGPGVPQLKITDVEKIKIPDYDSEKMKEKGDKAERLAKELEEKYKQIEEIKQEMDKLF